MRTRHDLKIGILGAVIALLMALEWGGCGYEFEAEGPGLPASAQTIYVAQFANLSRTSGAVEPFMRYLKNEIASHDRLTVVDSPHDADLILSGAIDHIDTQPGSVNSVDEPTTGVQQMSVSAQLTDGHTGKVIWSDNGISAQQRYSEVASATLPASPIFLQQNFRARDIAGLTDIQVAQTQMAAANQQVLGDLAHEVYILMSEGF